MDIERGQVSPWCSASSSSTARHPPTRYTMLLLSSTAHTPICTRCGGTGETSQRSSWWTRIIGELGQPTHLHHAPHVSVDVIFYITEYIREANQTGGGCTSKALRTLFR